MFIDFGDTEQIKFVDLRKLSDTDKNLEEIPPLVFRCVLAEIQPSILESPHLTWADQAIAVFGNFVETNEVVAEVYSVVGGIASVFIKNETRSINDILLEKGLAQFREENYMSKCNHDERVRKQLCLRQDPHSALEHYEEDNILCQIEEEQETSCDPPPDKWCTNRVTLKGPISPLETSLQSHLLYGAYKTIAVEPESVNSVLLNVDPADTHDKLLVASCLMESNLGGRIIARATTMMPNINGFGALMALLFCPQMELKRNNTKTLYATILTGLGYNAETKQSLFPDHDLLFNLDVEITSDDIEMVLIFTICRSFKSKLFIVFFNFRLIKSVTQWIQCFMLSPARKFPN